MVSDLSGFNRYADFPKETFFLSLLLKKIRLEECRNSFEVIWNNYIISVEELFMELSKKYWERYSDPLVQLLIYHARGRKFIQLIKQT